MTRNELREKVARVIEAADNSRIPDNYYKGNDPSISDWGMYIADAAIAIIRSETLEEAAKAVEALPARDDDTQKAWGYHTTRQLVAAAIRKLGEEGK